MDKASDPITGRHRGEYAIIVGTSPSRAWLGADEYSILEDAVIFGVNNAIRGCSLDYWVVCDTHRINTRMVGVEKYIDDHTQTFFSAEWSNSSGIQPDYYFKRPSGELDERYQPIKPYNIPTRWNNELQHVHSSATAAINLAAIMRSNLIILWGVDFVGGTRTIINGKDAVVPWANYVADIQDYIDAIAKSGIQFAKTNPDSPLDLPMWTEFLA